MEAKHKQLCDPQHNEAYRNVVISVIPLIVRSVQIVVSPANTWGVIGSLLRYDLMIQCIDEMYDGYTSDKHV